MGLPLPVRVGAEGHGDVHGERLAEQQAEFQAPNHLAHLLKLYRHGQESGQRRRQGRGIKPASRLRGEGHEVVVPVPRGG